MRGRLAVLALALAALGCRVPPRPFAPPERATAAGARAEAAGPACLAAPDGKEAGAP